MTTSKITTSTPLCIRENETMISTLEHLYTSPAVEMDYRLYTWPLIQHTINQRIFFLTQDDKKPQSRQQTKPEFYHAISLRPLYEITQTSMQDHSAYPTHAPSPKWHTTETPLKNLARSEIPSNSMYSDAWATKSLTRNANFARN